MNPNARKRSKSRFSDDAGMHLANGSTTIDWAQMAKQWIQMREDVATSQSNINVSFSTANKSQPTCFNKFSIHGLEKGEADMEMDEDAEACPSKFEMLNLLMSNPPPPPIISKADWMSIHNQTRHADQAHVPKSSAYTATHPPPTAVGATHLPSLLNIHVNNDVTNTGLFASNECFEIPNEDARKKKSLPAWIREGLEKLEKEKQKHLEQKQVKQIEDHELCVGVTSTEGSTRLSLVGSDMDRTYTGGIKRRDYLNNHRLKRQRDSDSDTESVADTANDNHSNDIGVLLLSVRRVVTGILLCATNEEFSRLVYEARMKREIKAKASSVQLVPKSALTTIRTKLGLAVYSDSSNDESGESSVEEDNDQSSDAEEELKLAIQKKRTAFLKVSDTISKSLECVTTAMKQGSEGRKDTALKQKSVESKNVSVKTGSLVSPESRPRPTNSGETNLGTKLHLANVKRTRRKERVTRFSDNKDTRAPAVSISTALIPQHSNTTVPNPNIIKAKQLVVQNPATALLQTAESAANFCLSATAAFNVENPSQRNEDSDTSEKHHSRHNHRKTSNKGVSGSNYNEKRSDSNRSETSCDSSSSSYRIGRKYSRKKYDNRIDNSSRSNYGSAVGKRNSKRMNENSKEAGREYNHGGNKKSWHHNYSSDSDIESNRRSNDKKYTNEYRKGRSRSRSSSQSYVSSHHRRH